MREYQDIQADLWQMYKESDPKRAASGGAKEMAAFAASVNAQP